MNNEISEAIEKLAKAIAPANCLPGTDAAGVDVESLTEAVMGITGGLVKIAEAVEELARAVDSRPL